MKTAIETMIEIVEKGYYENKTLWEEWKSTLLEKESLQLREAFFAGDDANFHLNVEIKNFDEFMKYIRAAS